MNAKDSLGYRPESLLCFAGELLRKPERWTPSHLALDVYGKPTRPADALAIRWNSLGALLYGWSLLHVPNDPEPFQRAAACLCQAVSVGVQSADLLGWEDEPERTHDDVVAALRRAMDLARAETGSIGRIADPRWMEHTGSAIALGTTAKARHPVRELATDTAWWPS